MNKPNGQTELKNNVDEIMKFLKDLPIGKVSGIGKVAEKTLNELGIKTCGDLKENMVYIKELFKPASYNFLLRASLGLGRTTIENKWERKSISIERTFSNTSEKQKLESKLYEISCILAKNVEKQNLKGKSVTLKVKTSSFETLTRCITISKYIYQQEDLFKIGKQLLESYMEERPNQSYRLMGLRLSSFLDEKNGTFLDKYVKVIDNDKNTVDFLMQQKDYECPVCFKMIKANNIMSFEKHVNNCLGENELKNNDENDLSDSHSYNKQKPNNDSSDSSESHIINKKFKLNKDNNYITKSTKTNNINYTHKNMKVKKQKGKQVLDDFIEKINDNKINININKSNELNEITKIDCQDNEGNNKIQCPICEQLITCSSNEELNRHIDICLNKDILKQF